MKAIEDRIRFYREDMLACLEREWKPFDSGCGRDPAYYKWYMELSEIRKYLLNIIHRHNPTEKHPYVIDGHRIDHHIYGYLAPMEILRKSYQGKVRTPAEHLSYLSKRFEEHGIRFIYAALPCKKAVYPEIILPDELLQGPSNIIPQWRHMLYDLICHGVEVVDFYPYFRSYRENNRLFSFDHRISCTGAILIGNILGSYLLDTTENISGTGLSESKFHARKCTVKEDNNKYQTEQVFYVTGSGKEGESPYMGTEVRSEIGIFGNCNLQKYHGDGFDITAHLSNVMGYPVNYLGRFLPFARSGNNELADLPDGALAGKKIVIYLGFPSAAFVRSHIVNDSWNTKEIPESCFR